MSRLIGLTLLGMVLLLATASPVLGTVYWTPAHELAPVGWGGRMTAADFDMDGDIDISVLGLSPAHQYWNAGSASSPEWLLDTTEFGDVPWCVERDGDLADLDADGDLDLAVVCWYDDFVRFYRNTGVPGSAVWEEESSVFEGIPHWGTEGHPRLVDMDADGDLDLLLGSSGGTVSLARNVGTASEPEFIYEGWISGIGFTASGPTFGVGDVDSDGDLDLVRVSWDTSPECFENIGTVQEFVFAENPDLLAGVSCPGGAYGMELFDIDGDGDPDMLLYVGGTSGNDYLLFLNGGATPVETTSWGLIKALYRG